MSALDSKPFRSVEVPLDECDGSFERMLRRFVRKSKDDGVLSEVRERARGFVKPSASNRRKKRDTRNGHTQK